MLRILKNTRNSAVRCRTKTITQLQALLISGPAQLRESLERLATPDLIVRCHLNPRSDFCYTTSAISWALHVLATRIHHLEQAIDDLGHDLDHITQAVAPNLRAAQGIGADNAAALLSAVGEILNDCDRRPHSPHSAVRPQSLPVQVTSTGIA